MASPVGLAIRNEKAQVRLNDALAKLAGDLGIEVPDQPVRRRDLFLNETFRLEWTADTLELLAGVVSESSGGVGAVYRERNQVVAALSKVFPAWIGPVDDQEPGWNQAVYIDLPTGQVSWHIPDQEVQELFGHLPVDGSTPWDGHSIEEKYERLDALEVSPESEDATDPQVADPDELKKLSLDTLKGMAADRGIEGVEDARAKAEVIEKLLEVAE